VRYASISWDLFVLFSGAYIETFATMVYDPKGSHSVKFFILNNGEISQQFYRINSPWIIYILANVFVHAPQRNTNDWELILKETHYYIGLMLQQCTIEL
jgi:hypothetical protein